MLSCTLIITVCICGLIYPQAKFAHARRSELAVGMTTIADSRTVPAERECAKFAHAHRSDSLLA